MNKQNKFIDHINKIGIPFLQFNAEANERANTTNESFEDELKRKLHGFTKLNQQRTKRILKTYKPSDEIKNIVDRIKNPQTWLIITEDWCGDSAQNLPYLFRMVEHNSNIKIKIIYRDEHLDIIDKYLTNGGRAIPKMVVFNNKGEELFQWGPRPEVAKQLVKEWKESGLTKEEFNEKLHLWYGRDRGKTLEKEFIELLR